MSMSRIPALLLMLATLAGCASSTTISPGENRKIFGDYRVVSHAQWARSGWRNVEVWTVDGPQLQQLRLYAAIEDGETLFEIPKESFILPPDINKDRPQFHPYMKPHDVAEMVTATLLQWGAVDARDSGLKPAQFGGREGFRFDLDFSTPGGVAYRGRVLAHIDRDEGLYLILFLGTRDHYFPYLAGEVESIFSSISWH